MKKNNFKKHNFVALILLSLSLQAQADVTEFSAGSTFNRSNSNEGAILTFAYVDTDKKYPIEYAGGIINGVDSHSKDIGYASIGLRKYLGNFFIGTAGILATGTNDRISSNLSFKSQVGYAYKFLVVKVEHISNAGTKGKNQGENSLTVGYQKRF